MTEHEIEYATHRECECGDLLRFVATGHNQRYPGRVMATIVCGWCGRSSAPGYSRYEQTAIARAWGWWDAGVVRDVL